MFPCELPYTLFMDSDVFLLLAYIDLEHQDERDR